MREFLRGFAWYYQNLDWHGVGEFAAEVSVAVGIFVVFAVVACAILFLARVL